MILVKFRNGNILNLVNTIGKGITDGNYAKIKEAAQTLKSQSGQVGACRVHYDCYFLMEAY